MYGPSVLLKLHGSGAIYGSLRFTALVAGLHESALS